MRCISFIIKTIRNDSDSQELAKSSFMRQSRKKVRKNMKNMSTMSVSELKSVLAEKNSQYFANSCCHLEKDDTNEVLFKINCALFSEALSKAFSRSNAICFRFDSSKCAFAKKYLRKYITKDRSDVVSQVSKKIFIECTILYDNLDDFLSVLAKATDKATDNSQLFAKKSRATAKKSQEATKQLQKTATVAKKATKQSQKTAK